MRRIAIFISFSGQGGVERMVTQLAGGLLARGYAVDMVAAKMDEEQAVRLPDGVRLIQLGAAHTWTSLPGLVRYLRRERPDALLAAKDRAIRVAVLARLLTGYPRHLAGRLGTTVSAALEGGSPLKRRIWYGGMRLFFRGADRLVAVSEGVAEDVRRITGLGDDRVVVVRNPVITPELAPRAAESPSHPWFTEPTPIILGAGRLTRQKDFPTLLRAFATVRRGRPCRLVLLGEGRGRASLEALARELGIAEDVDLPGFQPNPYPFIAGAALFVLSSRWEGSPNVLTEALALGTPVVATDCPSGPREILQGGRYGPLVSMGDDAALAAAIKRTLDAPLPAAKLKEAVSEYTLEASTEGYLRALGLLDS